MPKKKEEVQVEEAQASSHSLPQRVGEDYGSEALNSIARSLNGVIDYLNGISR